MDMDIVITSQVKIQKRAVSWIIIFIVLAAMPLQAIPMFGGEVENFKKTTTEEASTAFQRDRSGSDEEASSEQALRGTRVTAADDTKTGDGFSISAKEDSDYSFGIVMPEHFSEAQRNKLQQEIGQLLQVKRQGKKAELKKKINALHSKWAPQGVIIDPTFIAQSKASKKRAEDISANAKKLETHYENTLIQDESITQFSRCREFGLAATQAAEAWQQTAQQYQRIPGPYHGIQLQKTWADKALICQKKQEEIAQRLLQETKNISENATERILFFKGQCDGLMASGKHNEYAELVGAYQQIEQVQKVTEESIANLTKVKNNSSSPSRVTVDDPQVILALDIAKDALQYTCLEAERVHQRSMPPQRAVTPEVEDDRGSARTTNEASTSTAQSALQEEKLLRMMVQFQERGDAIKKYSEELLPIATTAGRMMTRGDMQFSDSIDVDNWGEAYIKLETALVLIDAVQQKMETSTSFPEDVFSLGEKQNYVLTMTQQAIEQLCKAIKILGSENYVQSQEIQDLLEELVNLQQEHPFSEF